MGRRWDAQGNLITESVPKRRWDAQGNPIGGQAEVPSPANPSALQRFTGSINESFGLPADVRQWPGDFVEGATRMVTDPVGTAKLIGSSVTEGLQQQQDEAYKLQHSPGIVNKLRGVGLGIPFFGPGLDKAGQQFYKGDVAGGAGTMIGFAAQANPKLAPRAATAGIEFAENAAKTVGRETIAAAKSIPKLPAKIQRTIAPTPAMTESAKNIPAQARFGAEKLFRATAPTGKNIGFRENLYEAAGDLAEIGRKVDLSESAGGVLNPDMRPRKLVDAITEHQKLMYETERVPQITKHGANPIETKFGPDATEGLKYLGKNAGESSGRNLATNALTGDHLPLSQIDQLAKIVNKELLNFEAMTPAERAAATASNKRLSSLKALDKELSGKIGNELELRGEPGIRIYERRYAALGAVKKQLSTRVNMAELQRWNLPGKGLIRPILQKNVAGASQAATANITSIGRELQIGLRELADSGLTADRGVSWGPRDVAGWLPERASGQLQLPASGETTPPYMYATQTPGARSQKLLPEGPPQEIPTDRRASGIPLPPPKSVYESQMTVTPAESRLTRDPKSGRIKKYYLGGEEITVPLAERFAKETTDNLRRIMNTSGEREMRQAAFNELKTRSKKPDDLRQTMNTAPGPATREAAFLELKNIRNMNNNIAMPELKPEVQWVGGAYRGGRGSEWPTGIAKVKATAKNYHKHPHMTIEQATDWINDNVEVSPGIEVVALRADDYIPAERFRPSMHRPDGNKTRQLGDGQISAVELSNKFNYSQAGTVEDLQKAFDRAQQYGHTVFLVSGSRSNKSLAWDPGETWIADHKIIAIIKPNNRAMNQATPESVAGKRAEEFGWAVGKKKRGAFLRENGLNPEDESVVARYIKAERDALENRAAQAEAKRIAELEPYIQQVKERYSADDFKSPEDYQSVLLEDARKLADEADETLTAKIFEEESARGLNDDYLLNSASGTDREAIGFKRPDLTAAAFIRAAEKDGWNLDRSSVSGVSEARYITISRGEDQVNIRIAAHEDKPVKMSRYADYPETDYSIDPSNYGHSAKSVLEILKKRPKQGNQ